MTTLSSTKNNRLLANLLLQELIAEAHNEYRAGNITHEAMEDSIEGCKYGCEVIFNPALDGTPLALSFALTLEKWLIDRMPLPGVDIESRLN